MPNRGAAREASDRAPGAVPADAWRAANQRALVAALAQVRRALARHAGLEDDPGDAVSAVSAVSAVAAGVAERLDALGDRLGTLAEHLTDRWIDAPDPVAAGPVADQRGGAPDPPAPAARPALDVLCETFRLSDFERQVLLVCAGIELDATFPALCAAAQGDPSRTYPTFGLALAALPGAHWSALGPDAALRRWRLVEVGGAALTAGPLRIAEPVLHFLTGLSALDDRLSAYVGPVEPSGSLVPSQAAAARRITATWLGTAETPLIQLRGADAATRRSVAHAAASDLGLRLLAMPAGAVPATPAELATFTGLWQRDAVLSRLALLVDCDDAEAADPSWLLPLGRLCERLGGVLLVSSRESLALPGRAAVSVDVPRPSMAEQREVWQGVLGPAAPAAEVDALVSQFDLAAGAIVASARTAAAQGVSVWEACRSQSRPQLGGLARRVAPAAAWDDLVLPAAQTETLREIAAQARHRTTVYDRWGFGARDGRGLGLTVMLAGPSGTGKTLAAEVLASELRLDLFRVDVSAVVSKYIGETEKNLDRVFRAAEAGGTLVAFEEAEAFFGQRTKTRDSHDRYANQEISYLLQRMEAYRGLAILTTNMKEALDPAFLRRIRFTVAFPFPDAGLRERIWRRAFPPATPTDGLDFARLAQLSVAGGGIRSIALNAAFLAAAAGQPVRMEHLLRAARAEFQKLERPLTRSEIDGWA